MKDPLTIDIPGDKSLTHRAYILGALARGASRVRRPLDGADTQATAGLLRALGCVAPPPSSGEVVIIGRGVRSWQEPSAWLDCGNSGTTARLIIGALAGQNVSATLTGDASLRARPMRRVTDPLRRMGARFEELEQPDRLPVRVIGGMLNDGDHQSAHASAQVKSALLLAGLVAGVRVRVTEPFLSRDHTERMLRSLGVPVRHTTGPAGVTSELDGGPRELTGFEFDVPGDFSSAAFFIALGVAGQHPLRVRNVGLNPTRTGLLDVLRRMGARVECENVVEQCGEPVGDVVAYPSALKATVVGGAEIPRLIDEVPIIAVLATAAQGETRVLDASELRVKESDRIAAMVANLRAAGVRAEELPDGLAVLGDDVPRVGRIEARHDHRIAMAFGVLGALGRNRIEIDDPHVVDVSFPAFWRQLRGAAGAGG